MITIKESNILTQPGDLIELISPTNKIYIFKLTPGKFLQTNRGILYHEELIGKQWGTEVKSHIGSIFYLFQPSLFDILKEIPRSTQIMYPKDIGYILIKMSIGPGIHIIEAGSGSGALTTALAWAVGKEGEVISYEIRPDVKNLAEKNLKRVGLSDRVTFKNADIANGFDETRVDAVFLDLPNAFDYIGQVKEALKPGGYFGCILPTANQITRLLGALPHHNFKSIEVCEILLRKYQPIQNKFRPTNRMVAHTGYLTFGRLVINNDTENGQT